MLVRAGLAEHLDVKFKMDDLQAMLRTRDLPVSGNKTVLIERLIQANRQEMWEAIADIKVLQYPHSWQTLTESLNASEVAKDELNNKWFGEAVKWILLTGAGGIIGNRSDAEYMSIQQYFTEHGLLVPEPKALDSPLQAPLSPLEHPDIEQPKRAISQADGLTTKERIAIESIIIEYIQLGIRWYRTGQLDKAIASYSRAIEIDPNYALAYYHRGQQAFARCAPGFVNANSRELIPGARRKAIEDYSKAIELNPRSVEYYSSRGNAWYRAGYHDKAIEDYSKAIELNPRREESYLSRSFVWEEKKKYEEAIADMNLYVGLSRGYSKAKSAKERIILLTEKIRTQKQSKQIAESIRRRFRR